MSNALGAPVVFADSSHDQMKTFAGFLMDFADKNTFDDTPEEREQFYEKLWNGGKALCSVRHHL